MTYHGEMFWLESSSNLVKPKFDFLSYSTRSERYNALIRLILVLSIIIAVTCALMEKSSTVIYSSLTIAVVLILLLSISYYLFKSTKETYVPFTVSPGVSWRNSVSEVYDARPEDSQDYGGLPPEAENSRRITNPDLYVGIEPGDKEARPVGIPDSDKTDLIYPSSSTRISKGKGMIDNEIGTTDITEGFTFRNNTYDPPLGWGALTELKEEETGTEEDKPVKSKIIQNYPGSEEKMALRSSDTTDLLPEVVAFKAGENPPATTDIPDLVPDRIYRGQVVQPSGRPGYTESDIPINNRMGNVDGGFPPQESLLIQDGEQDATLFTFNRHDEEGRPVSGVYEGVNVGGTVYSPSTALGGDPSRAEWMIEPGVIQYNYRNVPNDIWIGKPNFMLRSKIDHMDYQDPLGREYPELIRNPGYNDIKDQVIDQEEADTMLFRDSMMDGIYMRRNMTDGLLRQAPLLRGRYGAVSTQ